MDKARRGMRSRLDGHRVAADLGPVPTLADAPDGVSESGRVRSLRLPDASRHGTEPIQAPRPDRVPAPAALAAERRRLQRDLHDGVQNELVALIVKLALAQQDPRTPPALAHELALLEARAQTVLDSVRDIVRGIYPLELVKVGVAEALRAQAARAPMDVNVVGTAPRSNDEAEAAVYFSCSEAIQNVAKHAGRAAQVTVGLHHDHGALAVRVEDDGLGFDPTQTSDGVGLGNIHDRIQTLGGSFNLASSPGRGTALTISLPWPPRGGPRTDAQVSRRPKTRRFGTFRTVGAPGSDASRSFS